MPDTRTAYINTMSRLILRLLRSSDRWAQRSQPGVPNLAISLNLAWRCLPIAIQLLLVRVVLNCLLALHWQSRTIVNAL